MQNFRNLLLALSTGALLSIGWPAVGNQTWVLFFALVPLLFVEDDLFQRKKKGFYGYLYLGLLVWNIATTWWIWFASEVGCVLAITLNALFLGFFVWLFHVTRKKVGSKEGYIGFVIYWLAWENFHLSDWDLTWPWLTLGNGLANETYWIQWYEYTGTLGGSLWILLVNLLTFFLIKRIARQQYPFKKQFSLIAAIVLTIALPLIISILILHQYQEEKNPVEITVIQPNIDPYGEKFTTPPAEQLEKMLSLAASKSSPQTAYFVFPETALPRALWEGQLEEFKAFQRLKEFIANYPNSNMVMGLSSRKAFYPDQDIPSSARKHPHQNLWVDYYNSAMQVNNTASTPIYHKSRLVVATEKVPFGALFKPLEKYAINLGGASGSLGTQAERDVFIAQNQKHKIAPVICYESIYGEFISGYIHKGADLIFILTNDGWWENTPGYQQHLSYARLRAIEHRRSIARSANTGTSCFINQTGNVFQATPWWVPTAISQTINANSNVTFYTMYGDYIGRVSGFITTLMVLLTIVRSAGKKKLPLQGNSI